MIQPKKRIAQCWKCHRSSLGGSLNDLKIIGCTDVNGRHTEEELKILCPWVKHHNKKYNL